jgi:hypothetical protein
VSGYVRYRRQQRGSAGSVAMRGLKYVSWGDTTGYAVAAKAYVRALMAQGVSLSWTPMLTGRNPRRLMWGATGPMPRWLRCATGRSITTRC